MRRPLIGLVVMTLGAALLIQPGVGPAGASTVPSGFVDSVVLSGLTDPTVVQFSPDGRIFVGQKDGEIVVYHGLADTSPVVVADLSDNVDDYWDRGLLGLALSPDFPADPHLYVLYTYDGRVGGDPHLWGDACPTPPGPTTDGCVVSTRLSRLQISGDAMTGSEEVLVHDWCQQFPSHSAGTLLFGHDGYLYASAGDGASFNKVDYGQYGATYGGDDANPCGDPPGAVGAALVPPTAEGGALRAQSVRRTDGPASLDGTIVRIDPATGAGVPGNPFYDSPDADARRIVAYGLRNPFRMARRPGSDEVWVGDVGLSTWEEIDRLVTPTGATAANFGWPCYEGDAAQGAYQATGLDQCSALYSTPGSALPPYYAYAHGACVVSYPGCHSSGASITGMAFYRGGSYPSQFDGALFFADHTRNEIWAMLPDGNGLPDPQTVEMLVGVDATGAGAGHPVDLEIGPGGDLFYVDMDDGTIHRLTYTNRSPTAALTANPTNGTAPLEVHLDGSGSTDPESGPLTYSWDLDGDGTFGDATGPTASHTYSPGTYQPSLRVTDDLGASDTTSVTVSAGNTAPTAAIDSPAPAITWRAGGSIGFTGHATDAQDGTLPPSALSWRLLLHPCPLRSGCRGQVVQTRDGVSSGSVRAPDHRRPGWLELRLIATDSDGLSTTTSVWLRPRTVELTFRTNRSGPVLHDLLVDGARHSTPFRTTVVVGSSNRVSAPGQRWSQHRRYTFSSWSDGGWRRHTFRAPVSRTTYVARYRTSVTSSR
jgi:glucose/arabinose dehydrogenase